MKKGTGISSFRSKEAMWGTFLDFFSAQRMDRFPSILSKENSDRSCLYFLRSRVGRVGKSLLGSLQGCGGLFYSGGIGRTIQYSLQRKEWGRVACSYPPIFPDKQWRHWGESLLPPFLSKKDSGFFSKGIRIIPKGRYCQGRFHEHMKVFILRYRMKN